MISAYNKVFTILLFGSLCTFAAFADTPKEDPAPALQANIEGAVAMLSGKSPEQTEAMLPELRAHMGETFAIEVLVQRAFGRNWQRFNEAQREEVIDLLGRLLLRQYAAHIASGATPEMTIRTSRPIGPNRWEVISTITYQRERIEVIYRLAPIDGSWKVYDIIVEGANLVGNYRSQFDAHFQRRSVAELFDMLREKIREVAVES